MLLFVIIFVTAAFVMFVIKNLLTFNDVIFKGVHVFYYNNVCILVPSKRAKCNNEAFLLLVQNSD